MPSGNQVADCFIDHLPYEIDMLRVAAARLKKINGPGTDTNILIEVFCVHARNLIEFLDGRVGHQGGKGPDDFKANQFADGYTCAVEFLKTTREKINRRIAHLTTERCGDDSEKISVGECLDIYDELEPQIERFMAC